MIEQAKKYYNNGLSVIPVSSDKLPRLQEGNEYEYKWKKHQTELISPNDLFDKAWGIAILCGKVSGNLECIDIDTKYDITGNLFDEYKKEINQVDNNLLKKLVVEQTVSGGYHFIYRCNNIEGNKKLAKRYTIEDELKEKPNEKVKILLETRGEGGYFVAYPSPKYTLIWNDFEHISILTEDERQILFDCAYLFNEVKEVVKEDYKIKKYVDDLSPFDDYNENGDIITFLEQEGWRITNRKSDKIMLLRPGGEKRWSADYDINRKLLYIFTQSSEFECDSAYNHSQVLTYIKFNQDYSESAKWLIKEGYGKKTLQVEKIRIVETNEIDVYLKQVVDGTLPQGLKIGIAELDKYFCFKKGLYLINGFDNVGKSVMMLWKFVRIAKQYKWKFMIYAAENSLGFICMKIIEFQQDKPLKECNLKEGKEFLNEHFILLDNMKLYNYKQLLDSLNKSKADALVIDPYDALKTDLRQGFNAYNYHEETVTELQMYCRREDRMIWLNLHTYTGAARKLDTDGLPKAPQKSDTNYGVLFANSGDFFVTYHRKVQSKKKYRQTENHIRKVREIETGGLHTPHDKPVILRFDDNGAGFSLYEEESEYDINEDTERDDQPF